MARLILAALTLALTCTPNNANDLATPPPATTQQLITITTPDLSASPRAYAHLAVVEYNLHPVVPGRGSGIFLHVQIGKATSACASLRRPTLIHVLRRLRPGTRPYIAIAGSS